MAVAMGRYPTHTLLDVKVDFFQLQRHRQTNNDADGKEEGAMMVGATQKALSRPATQYGRFEF
jgi:hypothetical protein